jgi:hypothetical protein
MTWRSIGCVMALALGAAGCSDDGSSGGDGGAGGSGGAACSGQGDTFAAGMSKDGNAGKLEFSLMSADPAPPALSDNVWTVKITDMAGAAAEGATVTGEPWMPAHEHGSPRQVVVTESGGGEYVLDPVNFNMVGLWEVTIKATPTSGDPDEVLYSFCIGD